MNNDEFQLLKQLAEINKILDLHQGVIQRLLKQHEERICQRIEISDKTADKLINILKLLIKKMELVSDIQYETTTRLKDILENSAD